VPTFRVTRYVLSYGAVKTAGEKPFPWHSIILVFDSDGRPPVADAVVLFTPSNSLGNLSTPNRLTAYLPVEDFDTYHRILQTESPVFAEWTEDNGGRLTSFYLKTQEEPVGEGPVDRSGGYT
jgi:hypothetical protein